MQTPLGMNMGVAGTSFSVAYSLSFMLHSTYLKNKGFFYDSILNYGDLDTEKISDDHGFTH